jgi:hypothetical protein
MKFEAIKCYETEIDPEKVIASAIASARRYSSDDDPRAQREARANRYTSAGKIVDRQAREHISKHGGSYSAAVRAVLNADEQLRRGYIFGDSQ